MGAQYIIRTIAGGVPPPTPAPGTSRPLGATQGGATDSAGNVYFGGSNCVFKLDPSGTVTVVAGNSTYGYSGDRGAAVSAQLGDPAGVATDGSGNLYIADLTNNVIRQVSSGIITTIAGNGYPGYSGDGNLATAAKLWSPQGVAVDSAGNLYISDPGNAVIRKVSEGIITTFAGMHGSPGYSGDGYPATKAQINNPCGLAVDNAGNLYIADDENHVIRQVSPAGIITTVAGTVTGLSYPSDVAVDSAGNLYIADNGNNVIVEVSGGISRVIAGNGTFGYKGDGKVAIGAELAQPTGVAVDSAGNLYIADNGNKVIRKVSAGIITTIAGNGSGFYLGDGGPAIDASFNSPMGVATPVELGARFGGILYVADAGDNRVRQFSKQTVPRRPGGPTSEEVVSTVAGTGIQGSLGVPGPGTRTQLNNPQGVAAYLRLLGIYNGFPDEELFVYIADSVNNRILKVSWVYRGGKFLTDGAVTLVAGNGTLGNGGDNGDATQAELNNPSGIAVDRAGNLYIADTNNNRVRQVSTGGIITPFAGSGTGIAGYAGDGGPATGGPPPGTELNKPSGIAVDGEGNVYIADTGNNVIRLVAGGIITTIAGAANQTMLNGPTGVAVGGGGALYIADTQNNVIRLLLGGAITTIAGNGTAGYSGNGYLATSAQIYQPLGVAVDPSGSIYVADTGNKVIRVLQQAPSSTIINAITDQGNAVVGAIAPGELITIYGNNLGPSQVVNAPGNSTAPTQLGGTTVSFNGIAAPIISSQAAHLNVVVPYKVPAGRAAQVVVTYQGQSSQPVSLYVAPSLPVVQTSQVGGQANAFNSDGSLNSTNNPAKAGSVVALFATGVGLFAPSLADGELPGAAALQTVLPVSVNIGGYTVTPDSITGQPGYPAGMVLIHVQIPLGVPSSNSVPVVVIVGNLSSQNGVTLAVS